MALHGPGKPQRTPRWQLCVLLAWFGTGAKPLSAQSSGSLSKIWANVAIGYGSVNAQCDGCRPAPATRGITRSLSAGVRLSKHLRVGAEFDSWAERLDAGREKMTSLTAIARIYPLNSLPRWYILAGLGRARYASSVPPADGVGWDVLAGVGYHAWAVSGFRVSPFVRMNLGMVGDLETEEVSFVTGWRQTVLDGGISLAWAP